MNILGIDIGGTNTKLGIVHSNGNILAHQTIPTLAEKNINLFFDRLFHEINKFQDDFTGVGIGMPNLNPKTRSIQGKVNLSWPEGPLINHFQDHFKDKKILLENDANIAAIGERIFGQGKDCNDFITITLGTGLGTGIFSRGQILHGHDGLAGEGGHITIVPNGRECHCSGKGHLEAYVSAGGLERTCFEITGEKKDFRKIKEIFLEKKDPNIDKVVDKTAQYLALGLSQMQVLLSPQKFILTGGVSSLGESFLQRVSLHFDSYRFKAMKNSSLITLSQMPSEYGAILGAAAQFFI